MKINKSKLNVIAVRTSQYPDDNKPEFLLVGRSNVGKSSFINSLLGKKNYARTSSKPGKTQTLNFYLCNDDFYLVDVPGYGYAAVDKVSQKKFGLMIEEYIVNRPNLKRVFMLIDGRRKLTENDEIMYKYLKHFNITVSIIATKYDKIKPKDRKKIMSNVENSIDIAPNDDFVYFSSVTKKGREAVYRIINDAIKK